MSAQKTLKRVEAFEHGTDVRIQYGALCFRMMRGKPQVLLVTSRTRRRWIIPKGWPIEGKSAAGVARIEAWEEGGVQGRPLDKCIGQYSYVKRGDGDGEDQRCLVAVFPVKVKSLAKDFPERSERRRKWFSLKQAAKKVAEPDLRQLIRRFDPGDL